MAEKLEKVLKSQSYDVLTPEKLIIALPHLVVEAERQKKDLIGPERKRLIVNFVTDLLIVQKDIYAENPEIVGLLNASLVMLPFAVDALVNIANNGYLFVRTGKCGCLQKR